MIRFAGNNDGAKLAQDALEDALLMGCDEAQIRAVLAELISELHNPYRTRAGKK